ncbi:MAG: hypothetical protein E4H16_00190 [Candidatus Atribacteria bacterium]|nr:MAG: hypothetical protein E4H16_00190 [Candidatus Atribacteria bacterium]
MIDRIRFIWQLLVLASVLALLGLLLFPRLHVEISAVVWMVTLGSVTAVNLITYLVMYTGIHKNPRDGVVYLLGGIGIKFLLYLLFILLFWIVTKNLSKPFIIAYFALYLVFTFFTAGHLLKILKNK